MEICLKFEEVITYLSTSAEETSNLSKFFTSYKKILENFSSSLQRLSDTIKVNTNPESNFNSLSLALLTLKDYVKFTADSNLALVKNIQLDVIEPLDLFTDHFFAMFTGLKYKGLEVYRTVNYAQEKLVKQKKEYYKVAAEREKVSAGNEGDKQEASRSYLKLQQNQENCLNKYIEGIMEVNKLWDEYDRAMPQIMEDLQQNEESRIHFIKNSLEKYIKYHQRYENHHSVNTEKLGEIISNINSLLDIRVFVDLHKSKDQVYRESFVTYEQYKQGHSEKDDNIAESSEDSTIDSNLSQLLTQSNPTKAAGMNSDSFTTLSNLILDSKGRRHFIDCLRSNSNSSSLAPDNMTQIATLVKEMLSLMIKDSEYDADLFCSVIDISNTFYCIEQDRKKFLFNLLSPHQFWIDSKRWMQGLEYSISTRISNLKESKGGVLQYLGFFSSNKSLAEDKAEKVSAYILISQFISHMSKLRVPESLAANIIMTACKDYDIDSERRVLLLTELYSRSTAKVKLPIRNIKSNQVMQVVLKKTCKFLQFNDLNELGMTCKELNTVIKVMRCRRAIIEKNISHDLRIRIWTCLLDIPNIQVDYGETLKLLETSKELIGEINEIIDLDVVRCFQKISNISTQNLSNILKVYAYKNKEIGYCQGMNYIAGTFYLVLQSEEAAFKSLYSLISIFKMNSLFNVELSKIKKLFFILDRLIGTFLPELNETFRESWVFSDNYSSGWLLTLFASVFHSRLEVIVQVWDIFLSYGWKGIFRICLQILVVLSPALFNKSFEEILFELSSLSSKDIFTKSFFQSAVKIKVTSRLIKSIKLEFKSLKQLTTHN